MKIQRFSPKQLNIYFSVDSRFLKAGFYIFIELQNELRSQSLWVNVHQVQSTD